MKNFYPIEIKFMDNDAIKQNLWGEITKQWGETPPTDNVQLKTQILKRT